MMNKIKFLLPLLFLFACKSAETTDTASQSQNEPYRPQFHFTPETGWMNDPNGMVFYDSTYQLFYQYYPDSTVWGPMHWGHATSTDLVHWQHQPIALFPDSLGYIFSGSAVADMNNSSGFGADGKVPLVAVYTSHDMAGEKQGTNTYENQSIAYSTDAGKTWTKYAGNPVLMNPGIRDFRDPKVRWFEAGKKWIMTLAVQDHVSFYSSPDLKNWKHESDFGKDAGAHGGVWECPDLLEMEYEGEKMWVLIVNINPGGPNGGSATQYFTGNFNGASFTANHTETKWVDYGPDEYAGVTWSNTGDRTIFLGWMSNWQYAQIVPTKAWRSAMTIPRELGIQKIGEQYLVTSKPVEEMNALSGKTINLNNHQSATMDLIAKAGVNECTGRLSFTVNKAKSFSLQLTNTKGDTLLVGFDSAANQYFIDRTKTGIVDFEPGFGKKQLAPRFAQSDSIHIELYIDRASVELFADGGLTTMTAIYFPKQPMNGMTLKTSAASSVSELSFTALKSMYTP